MQTNETRQRIVSLARKYGELRSQHAWVYIINVVVVYFAAAYCLYFVIDLLASNARQPTRDTHFLSTVATAFRQLAVTAGIAVYMSAWVASVAALPDRSTVLWRCFWYFGPSVILLGINWMLRIGFWAISLFEFLLLLIPIFLVGVLFIQVSGPIIRSWMYRRAVDPDGVRAAEQRLHWPLGKDDWEEYEIIIPPDKYYGLLAGIFTVLFIILETTLGEFLSELLGSSGYIEASLIALFVGTIIYPFHNWTSGQFVIGTAEDRDSADNEPLTKQFVSKTKAYYRIIFVRYWYMMILAVVLGLFLNEGLARFFPLR